VVYRVRFGLLQASLPREKTRSRFLRIRVKSNWNQGSLSAASIGFLPLFKYPQEALRRRSVSRWFRGHAMQIQKDTKGQPMIEWKQAGGFKRAWIQRRSDPGKDWAGTGRYLNVVRVESPGVGTAGQTTDFPIFSKLSDEQILEASVCAI